MVMGIPYNFCIFGVQKQGINYMPSSSVCFIGDLRELLIPLIGWERMKNLWYTVLYGCTTSGGMRLCGVICRTIVVQITKGADFTYLFFFLG